ncbi:MAG: NAD-dependent DNA ligase LigA [Turicibacter sp.]|nr:NAD-dependent DNA ligase LigA [Turicibacter sp.]
MNKSINRIKYLTKLLNEASRVYYQENREIMSDFEYDRLYHELEELEDKLGIHLSSSPTIKVGFAAVDSLAKGNHDRPLLSLDKTKEVADLVTFLSDEHNGLLSWKLDGLTVVLDYRNGVLTRALTRGNGTVGEDITHNALAIKNIPVSIPYRERLLIRGEAVISYEDFDKIIETEPGYKTPRNLCSGTMRQLDSSIVAKRYVNFYAFGANVDMPLKSEQLLLLNNLGFDVAEYREVRQHELEAAVLEFKGKLPKFHVPTDGLVLTYDDILYSESLGATSKFPKDSLAFKWQDEVAETVLTHIEWNTSRTGLINPIAVFNPVELDGTTVSKASVHNISIIKQFALGEGDTIAVYKANMIIPQIAENLTKSDNIVIPEFCPVCKGKADIIKQVEGEALYCANLGCHARKLGALVHFCSRDALNIEGLSEQTLEKWINCGFIKDYEDIFTIESHKDSITTMEGFGEKSFGNLLTSIERAKDVEAANFIYALGIKNVGLSNAKLLCRHFGEMESLLERAKQPLFEEELLDIKGFGKVTAKNLVQHLVENETTIRSLLGILRIQAPQIQRGKLDGLTFVITGDLAQFSSRKALQAFIETQGGRCSTSVSSNTSYLINNNTTSTSAKNKRAKALNIPIIDEMEFLKEFG